MSKLIEAIDLEIAYGDVAACKNINFHDSNRNNSYHFIIYRIKK
jgi:hypothetical protein